MAYHYTGPAIARGDSHVHRYCSPEAIGWVPANPPKSGPPGPLVTGPVDSFPARLTRHLGAVTDFGDLLKQPLFLGALGLVAYVLWKGARESAR